MRLAMVLIAAGALCAQTRMPVGIVRGDVVSLQGSITSGELRISCSPASLAGDESAGVGASLMGG